MPSSPPTWNEPFHASLPRGVSATSSHESLAVEPAGVDRNRMTAASTSCPSTWITAVTSTASPGVRLMGKRPPSIAGCTCSTITRRAKCSGRALAAASAVAGGGSGWGAFRARGARVRGFGTVGSDIAGSNRGRLRSTVCDPRSTGNGQRVAGRRSSFYVLPADRRPQTDCPSLDSPCAQVGLVPASACRPVRGRPRALQRCVDVLHPRAERCPDCALRLSL